MSLYDILPPPVQDVLVSLAGMRRKLSESTACFRDALDVLMEMEKLPPDLVAKARRDRLRRILIAASDTRYYSGLLDGIDINNEDPFLVLRAMPVLDKESVRKSPGDFIPGSHPRPLHMHGTSGTTGTPLKVVWTSESVRMERALVWRHRIRNGCIPGKSWRGVLAGHRIVPLRTRRPPFWRINAPERQIHLSTYHISPETAPAYHRALLDRKVEFLEGYPSVLYALAWSLERAGLDVPMHSVFFGAEPMLPFQREIVERVFGCNVRDFYGLTERVVSASQFECGPWLHLNWENCVPEIVDASGNAVEEGRAGELVGTSLSNLGFVLLRYRTGDMTRIIRGSCSCGRCSPRIEPVDTKREDLLVMPDGSLLSASSLTYPFKAVRHIRESQILQREAARLTIRLVPDMDYTDVDGNALLDGLRRCLPSTVELELEILDSIPRTASGKYSFCISEIGRRLAGYDSAGDQIGHDSSQVKIAGSEDGSPPDDSRIDRPDLLR